MHGAGVQLLVGIGIADAAQWQGTDAPVDYKLCGNVSGGPCLAQLPLAGSAASGGMDAIWRQFVQSCPLADLQYCSCHIPW